MWILIPDDAPEFDYQCEQCKKAFISPKRLTPSRRRFCGFSCRVRANGIASRDRARRKRIQKSALQK